MFKRKDKKAQTIETYNKSAAKFIARYDEIVGTRLADIEEAFALIKAKEPRVFEIGFGSGKEAYQILKRTSHYGGIDVSEGMLAVAKKRNPKGAFMLADVEGFVFPKHLDIIFAFASLIHSKKPALSKVFDAMYEALNPGGVARISLKWGPKYKEVTKRDTYGVRTFYLYPKEDIEALPAQFLMLKAELREEEGQTWLELLLKKPTL